MFRSDGLLFLPQVITKYSFIKDKETLAYDLNVFTVKVQIFCEDHKNLKKSPALF